MIVVHVKRLWFAVDTYVEVIRAIPENLSMKRLSVEVGVLKVKSTPIELLIVVTSH